MHIHQIYFFHHFIQTCSRFAVFKGILRSGETHRYTVNGKDRQPIIDSAIVTGMYQGLEGET